MRRLTKADYVALASFRARLRRFLHASEENARREGITPQQHQLLLAIKGQPHKDWASIRELAEALQVRHHAAVGLVDRSERSDLVRREPDPDDRRQVQVRLSERGEAVLERVAHSNRAELEALRRAVSLSTLEGADPSGEG